MMNIRSCLKVAFLCFYCYSCTDDTKGVSKSIKNLDKMKEDKSFFITDSNNVRHEIFKISPEQFEQFKMENKLTFCDSVYNQHGLNAFKLIDGKVIVQESSKYALYPSLDVLLGVLKGYTGPYKREILYGKNPYGEDFPKKVNGLIQKMFDDFNINTENFNKEDILNALDSIIVRNRNKDFLDKNFLSFIALIGKYNIEEFGGKWKMVLANDKETWNPSLEINTQKVYFANYIIEDFLDSNVNNPATEVFETVRDIIRMNILGTSFNQKN